MNPHPISTDTPASRIPAKPLPARPARQQSLPRRLIRWFLCSVGLLMLCVVLYVASGWTLGSIPANASFQQTPDGIEIAILNNGIHCDLALPMDNDLFRWRSFLVPAHLTAHQEEFQYVLLGWGNRRFYLETRTWDDFKLSNALTALAGLGETVVHVDCLKTLPQSSETCRRIRISKDQYRALCESLRSAFKGGEARNPRKIPDAAYADTDAFFEGTGSYHLFHTCNVWTGRNLQNAGIRCGWWTPFSSTLFNSLPQELPPELPQEEMHLGYSFDISADGKAC